MDVVVTQRGARVAGPATVAFGGAMPAGGFAAGIRFLPGAAPSVLGLAAGEVLDDHAPLEAVWDRSFADAAADAPDAASALARLYEGLWACLPDARGLDPVVMASARALTADPGRSVTDLASDAGLSDRQLRRRFQDHVGYGPKKLARILRLQRLLASPAEPWAARALHAGYADQAHMTRECVALTGVSPTKLA